MSSRANYLNNNTINNININNNNNNNNSLIRRILSSLLNVLHLSLLLIPFVIFYIPIPKKKSILFNIYSVLFLIVFLTPLHWYLFDGQCIFTIWSKQLGDYKESRTTSAFSETNMKWLYYPIMKLIGLEWNDNGIGKMVAIHWTINITIIWFFLFSKLC